MDLAQNRGRLPRQLLSVALTALVTLLLVAPATEATATGSTVDVIVTGDAGAADEVAATVERLGGEVELELAVLHGVAAEIPPSALDALRASRGVAHVAIDRQVELLDDDESDDDSGDDDTDDDDDGEALAEGWQDPGTAPYDGDKDLGSLYHVTKAVGAHDVWSQHVTGEGVGVALIDSGAVPVEGLFGQVVNGPDLSFESEDDALRHLDSYGHGTHMAGIIAGRDSDVQTGNEHDARKFVGVAPDAHVVSVKVAAASGAVDVSQVIAGIDWVVAHRNDPELNIRVLNLSFGTDSLQDPLLDPLSFAVEAAWRHGIVVVASAGNDGGPTPLRNPARNPYVIAVGAAHNNGTNSLDDDLVADFSNHGTDARRVDLVAPGKSIASLRAPGSTSDIDFPGARVGERFFRGSGTSQSAAVVSGAVALLLEHRPELTPDQVKDLLVRTTAPMPHAEPAGRGAGQLDVKRAKETPAQPVDQVWTPGQGTGSLEGARGTSHVVDDAGMVLTGEVDVFGAPWSGAVWATAAASGAAWDAANGAWNGLEWAGTCLCSTSWAGRSWNGRSWNTETWNGRSWNGRSWNGRSWNGRSWNGRSWNSGAWSSS